MPHIQISSSYKLFIEMFKIFSLYNKKKNNINRNYNFFNPKIIFVPIFNNRTVSSLEKSYCYKFLQKLKPKLNSLKIQTLNQCKRKFFCNYSKRKPVRFMNTAGQPYMLLNTNFQKLWSNRKENVKLEAIWLNN